MKDFLCHSLSSEYVINSVQEYSTLGKSARKPYYIALDYLRKSIIDGKDYFKYEFYKESDQLGRGMSHPMETLSPDSVEAYREEEGSFERDCEKYFGSSNSSQTTSDPKKYLVTCSLSEMDKFKLLAFSKILNENTSTSMPSGYVLFSTFET